MAIAPENGSGLQPVPPIEVDSNILSSSLTSAIAGPPGSVLVNLLGVDYWHTKTTDGGDLYLTRYGAPFWRQLIPENWYEGEWFESNRTRLIGTSTVYRVPTRPVDDVVLQLVVKWSRVGEEVPLDTLTINKFINAEFNSPFEEFSLLMELRAGHYGPPKTRIRTQKPLAIFVPSERLQLWQTGRSESKIAAKIARNPAVELDILRQYVVLYGWIKGLDLVELADALRLNGDAREQFVGGTTAMVTQELELKGYHVVDMKPQHVIVRPRPDGSLLCDRSGQIIYGMVDYELLERTPEHEQSVQTEHRQHYLFHMAHRFERNTSKPIPAHLRAVNLLGVDYIFGHAESTGGYLWVVGRDPDLFNYFLPERWRRTPRLPLSESNQVFRTRTKDNINLVWKVSRMGETPGVAARGPREQAILDHGFNSPFEEFALALELSRAGFRTVYPRAIYMTGHAKKAELNNPDDRRIRALSQLLTPEGDPVVRADHDYITIWGFWNGPDEMLAVRDGQYFQAVNGLQACQKGYLTKEVLWELLEGARCRMSQLGFEDLNFKADHLLLSFAPDNLLVHDTYGKPELRLCNFELVRRLPWATGDIIPAGCDS